jgi:hypothetical protein
MLLIYALVSCGASVVYTRVAQLTTKYSPDISGWFQVFDSLFHDLSESLNYGAAIYIEHNVDSMEVFDCAFAQCCSKVGACCSKSPRVHFDACCAKNCYPIAGELVWWFSPPFSGFFFYCPQGEGHIHETSILMCRIPEPMPGPGKGTIYLENCSYRISHLNCSSCAAEAGGSAILVTGSNYPTVVAFITVSDCSMGTGISFASAGQQSLHQSTFYNSTRLNSQSAYVIRVQSDSVSIIGCRFLANDLDDLGKDSEIGRFTLVDCVFSKSPGTDLNLPEDASYSINPSLTISKICHLAIAFCPADTPEVPCPTRAFRFSFEFTATPGIRFSQQIKATRRWTSSELPTSQIWDQTIPLSQSKTFSTTDACTVSRGMNLTADILASLMADSDRIRDSSPFVASDMLTGSDCFVQSGDRFSQSKEFNGTDVGMASNVMDFSARVVTAHLINSDLPRDTSSFPRSDKLTRSNGFVPSEAPGQSGQFRSSINQEPRIADPGDSGSTSLGLILGIVFAVLVVAGAVVAFIVHRKMTRGAKPAEEPEVDPVTQFYDDNRNEVQAEYEMAFDNPVFDQRTAGGPGSGDEFEGSFDEAIVI